MSPYYNELPTIGMDEEAMIVLGVMLVFLGIVLVCCLVGWILSSVGLHKVAKRRGIAHAWLAWIPIGSQWILGSVSDQYEHLVQNKITSRRKILLILNVAAFVCGIAYVACTAMAEFMLLDENAVGGLVLAMIIPYFLFLGVNIALMVFYHICNYDLYRSCKPESAVVFLVLGIVLPVCQPFFYFACRKKDLGMIVKKPAPAAPAAPEQIPAEPAPAEPAELPPAEPEI